MEKNIFAFAILTFMLGWWYVGWGFILFPISIFALTRSNIFGVAFWVLLIASIAGFVVSVWLIAEKVAKFSI